MFFQPYNSIKNKITRKFHYVYFNVSDDATRGEILFNIDKKKKILINKHNETSRYFILN